MTVGELNVVIGAKMDGLDRDLKRLDGKMERASQNTQRSWGKAFTRISALAAGAFSVTVVTNYAKEAVALAGKLEGVEAAFNKLDDPALLSQLRAATKGTVSDLELMQQAVRAKNFKIPLDQLATYFQFATNRAAETGESVDYLVNSIIDGIGRKSTLVMDNLGISAAELQDEIKKTGDFGAAAGAIIAREMQKAGDVELTTAQRTRQLQIQNENLQASVGQGLIPIYNKFLGVLNTVLNGFKSVSQVMTDVATSMLSEQVANDRAEVEQLAKAYLKTGVAVDEKSAKIRAAKDMIDQYRIAMKSAEGDHREQIAKQMQALSNLVIQLTEVKMSAEGAAEAMGRVYQPQVNLPTKGIPDIGTGRDLQIIDPEAAARGAEMLGEVNNQLGQGIINADSLGNSLTNAFFTNIAAAESFGEAMGQMVRQLVAELVRLIAKLVIIRGIMAFIPGANMATAGQGLLGGLFGGFKAAGGPVIGGRSYIVGERGPELFTPGATGSITPNHKMGGGMVASVAISGRLMGRDWILANERNEYTQKRIRGF